MEDKEKKEVEISGYPFEIVKAFISYLYSGICIISHSNVKEIMHISDKYKVPLLKIRCFEFIVKCLDKNSVCDMIMKAKSGYYEFDTTELVEKCVSLIETLASEVFESNQFLQLDEDIVCSLCKSNMLNIEEIDLYKAVVRWGKNRCKDHENFSDLKDVLKNINQHIRYPLILIRDLISEVKPDGIMSKELYIWALEFNCSPESFQFVDVPVFHPRCSTSFSFTILTPRAFQSIQSWISQRNNKISSLAKWDVIYTASKDGWDAANFHSHCDYKGETIVVIKANNCIFGGYNPDEWSTMGTFTNGASSFLFSIDNGQGFKPILVPSIGKNNSSFCFGNFGYGPTFGTGHDLYISSFPNLSPLSYCNLGHTYSLPHLTVNSSAAKNFFCGSYQFKVDEIEVLARKQS